jgi:glycosyltransferase involved in cell wall biosynthesis
MPNQKFTNHEDIPHYLEKTVSSKNIQSGSGESGFPELEKHNEDIHDKVFYLQAQVDALAKQNQEILNSKAWKFVMKLRRISVTLLQPMWLPFISRGITTLRSEGVVAFLRKILRRIKKIISTARNKRFYVWQETKDGQIEEGDGMGNTYVPISDQNVDSEQIVAKVIAFYLPQFHPIPENDEWWGKGFTEWTNVSKAVSNFEGHYQPRLPGELGFYDLRFVEIQKRQVELAKQYGVYGFCFYYYWFAGKRLLERPLDQYLANADLDLPFCLCWANENWTRRWDGAEHEILIGQTHNEQEYLHFIQDISQNFSDPRYIRVDGKPILLVYRINLLPDPQKASEIWRSECKRLGVGDIYLVAVQSFGITDPRPYGFDAAVEFPPHYLGQAEVSRKSLKMTNPKFRGKIFDYNSAVQIMTQKKSEGYTLFKTVMPSWDNTARRQNEGHIFINSTPSVYKKWLADVITYTRKKLPKDKRLVFINAWNEWAEGTHLEPDCRYGYAYLQATADAIQGLDNQKFNFPPAWKILFVSHDAHRGGAQAALLSTIEWFKQHTSLSVKVLCLDGGVLLPRFQALTDTILLSELQDSLDGVAGDIQERLLDFCGWKPDLIYGNTVVAGKAYQWLHSLGVPILTHVYELEMSIQRYAVAWMGDVLKYSNQYIAPSNAVKDNLVKNHAVDSNKIVVVYGAVPNEPLRRYESEKEKKLERKKLRLDPGKIIIVGCGLGMPFRKGADIFIELADVLRRRGCTDFHFYWIGDFEDSESDPQHGIWADHKEKLAKNRLGDFITFLGYKENFKDYFQVADIFVLSSREDPLPLVAIEAAKCGLPLVCFADAGGTPDLVGDDAGFVVPFEDVELMAEKILKLMGDAKLRTGMGAQARKRFLSQFTVESATPNILSTCRKAAGKKPAVSVIVPNYNHARYLPERLESIFGQTFQDFEVILLDDASTDNSMEVFQQYAGYGDVQVHKNDQNSGSPFRQWLAGLDKARADILWIAESDDVCKPEFLESLLPAFRDPAVKLAYANSDVIDESSRVVGDYSSDTAVYLTSLSSTKWKNSYITTANREINDALGIKNTILNVSAVLLRKIDMPADLKNTLGEMRIAGDWYFYVHAIKDGKVYYDFRKLNSHRRHSESVIAQTVSDNKIRDYFYEFSLVHKYIFSTYQLDVEFRGKWEKYLFQQLSDFSPSSNYDLLIQYYPLDEMKALFSNIQSSRDV